MRKSFLQFAYMGAIALMSSVGFSACSDEVNDPVSKENIVEHVSDASGVPVQFVFNVSTEAAPSTRMSVATTQTDNSFRGIDEAHLYSYQVPTLGDWVTTPAGYNKKFDYTSLMGVGTISHTNSKSILELSLPTNTNAMTFYGVALKNGSSDAQGAVNKDFENLKFSYVQRTDDATFEKFKSAAGLITVVMTGMVDTGHKRDAFDIEDREYYFWWDDTSRTAVEVKYYDGTLGDSTSDYQQIYNSPGRLTDPTKPFDSTTNPEQGSLAAPIYVARDYNDALESTDAGLSNTKIIGGKTYKLYHSTITWKQYGMWVKLNKDTDSTNDVGLLDVESDLGTIYDELTVIKDKELRASTSESVLYMVNDLMSSVTKLMNISPLSYKMQIAKRISQRINYRITRYFQYTTNNKWEWLPLTTTGGTGLKDQINNVINTMAGTTGVDYYPLLTTDADITGFPTLTYNVPPGAALMKFAYETSAADPNDGGTFSYLENIPNYDLGGSGTTTVTVQNYVYPAELMYFGNSALRVSNKELSTTDFPNGAANWIDSANWDTTSGGDAWSDGADKVTSETKSVAMMGNINYGVAVLETNVKLGATSLKDNNAAINPGESDKTITVDDSSFELTGIIIGCQPTSVGWNYLATSVAGENKWDRLVYDNAIINQSVPYSTTGSPASYTLLFDNYCMGTSVTATDNDGGQEDQPPVFVALEFVNKAGNFWGMHNLVRKNGKFYLIGKLDVKNGETPPITYKTVPDRTDGYAMPPYTDGHTSNNIARVFMQDYMTKATFVIGVNSLKSAYVTVPNLQSSQLSLGLSVDVKWETGIDFGEVTLGQ